MKARIINISLTHSRGRVYASSNDMPGLYVSGYTADEVLQDIPEAIRALYEAEGIKVLVTEAESSDDVTIPAPWVAVPLPSAA